MDSNKIPKHIIIVQPLEMESCSLNCIEIKKKCNGGNKSCEEEFVVGFS